MTVGEKIKKYRLLQGMTQKQLGEAVGFKKSTADVRINQYETDKMAPKTEIRSTIASVLDVDLEAISDIDIASFIDVMYVLFEFEEEFGMEIEKKDGKTWLAFDDSKEEILTLISFLNFWKNQKSAMVPNRDSAIGERLDAYERWKGRFAKNITDYYCSKETEINRFYDEKVNYAENNIPHARLTSEITRLLRKIIEAGFTVATRQQFLGAGHAAQGFTFVVNELLNPPSEDAAGLFARFLSELHYFESLGAKCFTDMQMPDQDLTITYFIPVSSFQVILSQVDMFLEFRATPDSSTDFSKDMFERKFEANLNTINNVIKDEIEMYTI